MAKAVTDAKKTPFIPIPLIYVIESRQFKSCLTGQK
jgi:hypothetical protein